MRGRADLPCFADRPSTFYAHLAVENDPDKASERAKRDAELRPEIERIWDENHSVYGARKLWHAMKRETFDIARCTVERLMRDIGIKGVRRGTFVDLNGKGLLYTNGSIPYYGTYPGVYVPNPLLLCPHESSDSTIAQIAEEVFSLTKINWNSTQMNQRLPIPIRASRKVGEVLKYVTSDQSISTDYRRYI